MTNLITKLRGIPIWVSVSGIIAFVLVGVVVSAMLLGSRNAGGHGGNRESGSQMGGMNHTGCQTEPVTPSELQMTENPTPSHHPMPTRESEPSDGPNNPTATPPHGAGNHTRSDGCQGH